MIEYVATTERWNHKATAIDTNDKFYSVENARCTESLLYRQIFFWCDVLSRFSCRLIEPWRYSWCQWRRLNGLQHVRQTSWNRCNESRFCWFWQSGGTVACGMLKIRRACCWTYHVSLCNWQLAWLIKTLSHFNLSMLRFEATEDGKTDIIFVASCWWSNRRLTVSERDRVTDIVNHRLWCRVAMSVMIR